MTIAGMNVAFRIYWISTPSDDYAGGALTSGSVVYDFVRGRLEEQPTTQQFLEQGLETTQIFDATAIPGTLDIRDRDEIELTKPTDHTDGNFFRVVGSPRASHNPRDPRNYLMLTLTRSIRAHVIQTR